MNALATMEDISHIIALKLPPPSWETGHHEEIPYNETYKEVESNKTYSHHGSHKPPLLENNMWSHFPKIEVNKFDGSDLTS